MTVTDAPPSEATNLADDWSPTYDDVTPEEIIRRAKAVAPLLRPLQAETEKHTRYSLETHELFRRAGFYRILTPKRYGGLEFSVDTFFKVAMALGSGCASTGWMYCLGHAHTLTFATFWDQQVQDEVFTSPDFLAPGTVKPQGEARRLPNGDWELTGVWNYCSGSPYAQWFTSHTIQVETGEPLFFIVPRERWTLLDDWGSQLGLKGTGSNSIQMEKTVIPARYAKPGWHLFYVDVHQEGVTPGEDLHGNPQYGASPYAYALIETAAIGVGMAQGALKIFEEMMTTKTTTFAPFKPRVDDVDYQRWYGLGYGKVLTAESVIVNATEQMVEIAKNNAFTAEQDRRIVALATEALDLAWDAMQIFFRYSGSGSVVNGTPMERVWRDMSTLRAHSGLLYFTEISKRELTQAHFDGT